MCREVRHGIGEPEQRRPTVRTLLRGFALAVSALTSACSTTGLERELEEQGPFDEESAPSKERDGSGPRDAAVRDRPLDAGAGRRRDGGTGDARVLLDARLNGAVRSDGGDGDALLCPSGSYFPVVAHELRPLEGYDYIAIREASEPLTSVDAGAEGWSSTTFHTLSEAGTRCARAVGGACASKVMYHPVRLANPVCIDHCSERAIVTTRGDEVRRWSTPAELVTLFGPVDSSAEALMLVAAAGYWLKCDDEAYSSLRELADGYEVYATRTIALCPVKLELVRLHVSLSGQVNVRSSKPLPQSGAACISLDRK
jgi:hypothetical protein